MRSISSKQKQPGTSNLQVYAVGNSTHAWIFTMMIKAHTYKELNSLAELCLGTWLAKLLNQQCSCLLKAAAHT